jgi:hypothetical protein
MKKIIYLPTNTPAYLLSQNGDLCDIVIDNGKDIKFVVLY